MDFLSFVEQSNRSPSREHLIKSFENVLLGFGINGFVYSLVRGSFAPNNKIIHGAERSYPEEWMKHYAANDYVEHDPTYRQIIKKKGAFTWKSLPELQPLTKKEKQVMNEAEDAGLKNGISLSLHGPYGKVLGFGFISSANNEGLSKNELSILYAMANQFHLAHSTFDEKKETSPAIKLSDRQKEILQWAAVGKSRSAIADILNISEDTVDDHFRHIFKKLRCNDRVLAVLKAVQFGLITV